MNITCTIDNQEVSVKKGTTILSAAETVGIHIPTLCHLEGYAPFTSCMVCVVRDQISGELMPACTTMVKQGMIIDTISETVYHARREALNMLLSEHVGDCRAPCTRTCPAHPNTPRIIRYIKEGKIGEALEVMRMMNPFPAITGHICSAPCEKSCTRGGIDSSVSIKLLEKYIGNSGAKEKSEVIQVPKTGKKVAIVGTGPAGLASAYYLLLNGHSCTLFEKESESGGALRKSIPSSQLPRRVLDNEIAFVETLGGTIRTNISLGKEIQLSELQKEYDAVILAVGKLSEETFPVPLLMLENNKIRINKETFETDTPGVFASGVCVRHMSMAIRAIDHGRRTAEQVHFFLGQKIGPGSKEFDSIIKKYTLPELNELIHCAQPDKRVIPKQGELAGFGCNEAEKEAARCLHCDCYKSEECFLRKYAGEYKADQHRYVMKNRNSIQRNTEHPFIIREISKCIKCGRCVRLTENPGTGLSFIERGYKTKVVMPFNLSFTLIPDNTARLCVRLCPTGALAFKE